MLVSAVSVAAIHYGPPPLFVVEIPPKSLRQSNGQLDSRRETQFALNFPGIDRVTPVVTRAIGDKLNE